MPSSSLRYSLRKIFVLEKHRRIALFSAQNLRRRNVAGFFAGKRASRLADQCAGLAFRVLTVSDRSEQMRPKTRIPNSIVEHRFFRAAKTGDDGARRGLRNRAGGVAGRDLNRKRVGLRSGRPNMRSRGTRFGRHLAPVEIGARSVTLI